MKKIIFGLITAMLLLIICFGVVKKTIQVSGTSKYKNTQECFVRLRPQEVITKVSNREAGVYYFGFPACPWCQEFLPLLQETLIEEGEKGYLVNTKSDDFLEEHRMLMTEIYLEYIGGDRFYVPFLLAIDGEGKVLAHSGTVIGHDATQESLSSKQSLKLKKLIKTFIAHSKN